MRPSRRLLEYGVVAVLLAGSFWLGKLVLHNHRTHADGPVTRSAVSSQPVAIVGHTPDGEPRWIRSADIERRTLLLILSVECPFCERNMPGWVGLVDDVRAAAPPQPVDVVAVSVSGLDETRTYLDAHGLDVPVLLVDRAELRAIGVPGVPATLALTPGEAGVRSWSGVLDERARTAVLDWAAARSAMAASDATGPATR